MNIIKQTGTANTTSAPGRKIQYIAIHYTAGTSSATGNARANASWFTNPSAKASADFVVDDTEIVQVNPDPRNRYCWAVGGKEGGKYGGSLYGIAKNSNTISIQICSNNSARKITYPNDPRYTFTQAAVNNAIKLTQYLMKEYGIPADRVVRHYDISAKLCPGVIGWNKDSGDDSKWVEFKSKIGGSVTPVEQIKYKVRTAWENEASQKGAFIYLDKAKECADANPGYTVFDLSGKAIYTSKGLSAASVIANQTKEKSIAFLSTLPDYKGLPSSKEDYINKVSEIAVKLYPYTLILPSVVIAQACLQNGYGIASDAIELTKRSNLIGQKADLINSTWQDQTVWNGEKFSKRTPEVYNGVPTTITDWFRVFPNYAYSILDYELFLTHVKKTATQYKYREVVGMTDPEKVITTIRNNGYATGVTYITNNMRIIKENDLTRFDKVAFKLVQEGGDSVIPVVPTPSPAPVPAPVPTPSGKRTVYRVQVGAYTTVVSRENKVREIKNATGLDCFYESSGGRYYLFCGSFDQKAKAAQRQALLKGKNIDCFIKEHQM